MTTPGAQGNFAAVVGLQFAADRPAAEGDAAVDASDHPPRKLFALCGPGDLANLEQLAAATVAAAHDPANPAGSRVLAAHGVGLLAA